MRAGGRRRRCAGRLMRGAGMPLEGEIGTGIWTFAHCLRRGPRGRRPATCDYAEGQFQLADGGAENGENGVQKSRFLSLSAPRGEISKPRRKSRVAFGAAIAPQRPFWRQAPCPPHRPATPLLAAGPLSAASSRDDASGGRLPVRRIVPRLLSRRRASRPLLVAADVGLRAGCEKPRPSFGIMDGNYRVLT